jgi:hypothetical protein
MAHVTTHNLTTPGIRPGMLVRIAFMFFLICIAMYLTYYMTLGFYRFDYRIMRKIVEWRNILLTK